MQTRRDISRGFDGKSPLPLLSKEAVEVSILSPAEHATWLTFDRIPPHGNERGETLSYVPAE